MLAAALAAAAVIGGSFASFVAYRSDLSPLLAGAPMTNFPDSFSAWSNETFLFPLSVLPVALAALVLALILVGLHPDSGHRRTLLGSRPAMVIAATGAMTIMLGYAASTKTAYFGTSALGGGGNALALLTLNFSTGGIVMLVACLAMTAGAVAHLLGLGPELIHFAGSVPVFPNPGASYKPGHGTNPAPPDSTQGFGSGTWPEGTPRSRW
ncbi:hypothetical protein [Fodinicola feengrottensis]|uniref:hypothetical protein n=1 Tax=Fodinicola feengrottensis TaxID=435914 RepID=UPI0031DCD095